MLHGKNLSSEITSMHYNIASIKTSYATKIMCIVLSPTCNMYAMKPSRKPCLHTVMTDKTSVASLKVQNPQPYHSGYMIKCV